MGAAEPLKSVDFTNSGEVVGVVVRDLQAGLTAACKR